MNALLRTKTVRFTKDGAALVAVMVLFAGTLIGALQNQAAAFDVAAIRVRQASAGPHDDYVLPYAGGRLSAHDVTLKTLVA